MSGPNDQASSLLLDEYYANEDPRFVETLRGVHSGPKLAGLAERWKRDRRPWARERIKEYLALPMNVPGHEPVVKRLFKQAWAAGDDELMGLFMAGFDRLVRRRVRARGQWDPATRQIVQIEEIRAPKDVIPRMNGRRRTYRNPATGELATIGGKLEIPGGGSLFSYRTRGYLRRRAWRYFRLLAAHQPGRYCAAVAGALALYRDEDVASGINLLDNWSLLHALFRRSPALAFKISNIEPAPGHALGELAAAPAFEKLWADGAAGPVLLDLLAAARARVVRVSAVELLRRHHAGALAELPLERVFALLNHEDADVQQFAAGLFKERRDLGKLGIDTWLRLLNTENPQALELLCGAMEQNVATQRVAFEKCVELACARPSPVAAIGLKFLAGQEIGNPGQRRAIVALAGMKCGALAGKAAAWALGIAGGSEHYTADAIVPFFDSLHADARERAWEWLNAEGCPAADDPVLWTRLVETPYSELRLKLVETLARRKKLPGAGPDRLTPLWQAVVLNIFRGGRQKRLALTQISAAILDQPEKAGEWLPLLAAAIRSLRPTEARAGLAAIMTAVERDPGLAEAVRRLLPELDLNPSEVVP
ncbi:MAG: hypothetical protein ABFD69_15765 [Candidatus Sumerlaeia bacterium]